MKRLDGFLSRKAQAILPRALVLCDSSGPVEIWVLVAPGHESLDIGSSFRAAKAAIEALAAANKGDPGA